MKLLILFIVWSVLALAAGGPSFWIGYKSGYSLEGMIQGLFLYCVFLTYVLDRSWFAENMIHTSWRRAFFTVVALRLLGSGGVFLALYVLKPLQSSPDYGTLASFLIKPASVMIHLDIMLLKVSSMLVELPLIFTESVARKTDHFPTLFATFIQGSLLSIVVLTAITLVDFLQKLFFRIFLPDRAEE